MANETPITVCVVALVHGQYEDMAPADLKAEILAVGGGYDVVTKGKIYGGSPDDWCPFDDGKRIWEHLRDASFDANFLSGHLAGASDSKKLAALVGDVDLYIFDPLFLAYQKSHPGLIDRLDAAIQAGTSKAFCVVLPERLPQALRDRLDLLCNAKLPLSAQAYEDDGRGRWAVAKARDFRSYLKELSKEKEGQPVQLQLQQAVQVLMSLGAHSVNLSQPPRISRAQ